MTPLKSALIGLCLLLAPGALQAKEAATVPCAEAKTHVGQTATVVGPVSGIHVTAKGDAFINLGPEYPDQDFTVVVFADDVPKFEALEGLRGRTVAVTGAIKEYRGKPEIVLKDPAQLKLR